MASGACDQTRWQARRGPRGMRAMRAVGSRRVESRYPIGYQIHMRADLGKTAEVLRAARTSAGLTLRAAAEKAGTSHATFAAYEAGRKSPTLATLFRLLHACGFAADL